MEIFVMLMDLRHVLIAPISRQNHFQGRITQTYQCSILCDEVLKGAKSSCGFCLNTGTLCKIYLVVRSDAAMSINMAKSHCQNLRRIKLKLAENFTMTQPCLY
jgi:hypothetical protein